MNTVFETNNLSKRFGDTTALDGIELQIPSGSVVGLIGPNGSGKSTLLLHATGQCLPTEGSCHTFDTPGASLGATELARLGVVHQQDSFLPWMSVRQQLAYVGSFYDRWDQELEKRLLEEFELRPDVRVATLSPGNAQKLSIILAVCHRPELLLLDEPVSALDPLARERFFRFLFELVVDSGVTVIVSSHVLRDIERLVSHIVCLERGKLRINSELDELRERYREWHVTARADLPQPFDEPFILEQSRSGRQARLVVSRAAHERQAFAARHAVEIAEKPLGLEAIYPFLLDPSSSDSTKTLQSR